MESVMKISRYVKIVDFGHDNMIALYHSLRINSLFVKKSLAKKLIEGTANFDELDSEFKEALFGSGFVVDSKDDDDKLIDSIRNSLPEPCGMIMYLLLTSECNFSCAYCSLATPLEDNHLNFMSKETVEGALDLYVRSLERGKSKDLRKAIIFYGGEPLLNESVFRFAVEGIEKLKKEGTLPNDVSVGIVTNGSMLTRELAIFMSEKGVNLSISLDGDRAATDLHRNENGYPVFENVIEKINILKELGIKFGISCTINSETIREGERNLSFLIDELGVRQIGFNIIMRTPGLLSDSSYLDYDNEVTDFIINSFKVLRKKGIFEERIMRKVRSFVDQKIHPYDCSACGGHELAIAPDGDIGICHAYTPSRKYFVGNVNDYSLIPEETEVYREWHKRSPLFMHDCQDCVALGICGGGCPCNADLETGSIWSLDERFCIHAKKILNWMIADLWNQVLLTEAAID